MISLEYRTNRAAFPRAELERYRGLWVAFSPEGTQIVASGKSLDQVEEQVKTAGEDPNEVVFERIPGSDDDVYLAGSDLR